MDGLDTQLDFHSLLVAEYEDLDELVATLCSRHWANVYVVLGRQRERLWSLFQLPELQAFYQGQVKFFDNIAQARVYFSENSSIYLPKRLLCADMPNCVQMIQEIHQERVRNIDERSDKVFLSICMPTYNRGEVALGAVRRILQSGYDAEIEIIVRDNGSVSGCDAYAEIAQIKDVRLRYFKAQENEGYAANVFAALQEARGQYAILTSDEDLLKLEQLGEFLNYLVNNTDAGIIFSNIEEFRLSEPNVFSKGSEAFYIGIAKSTYMTGQCINMSVLRQFHIMELIVGLKDNYFVQVYIHSAIAMLAGNMSDIHDCGIELWVKGEELESPIVVGGMPHYMWVDSRQKEAASLMEIASNILTDADFQTIFCMVYMNIYGKIGMAYEEYSSVYSKKYSWREICVSLFKHFVGLVDTYKSNIQNYTVMVEYGNEMFWDWMEHEFIFKILGMREGIIHRQASQLAKYQSAVLGIGILDIDFAWLEDKVSKMLESVEEGV